MRSVNTDLIENLGIDSMDIVESLLNCVSEYEREAFDKDALDDMVYWLYAAAQNEYNSDYFRGFYNLLQLVAENNIVPF